MQDLSSKLHLLGDLELAALLSLIANEHSVIWTDDDTIDTLAKELELVAAQVFGLSFVTFDCSQDTTLDEFSEGILVADRGKKAHYGSPAQRSREGSYFSSRLDRANFSSLSESLHFGRPDEDCLKIPNVVIVKHLNLASDLLQVQALELLRNRRLYTRTTLQSAPARFLFIPLLATSNGPLLNHLNDHIFISHYHALENGFPNLEGDSTADSHSDASSQRSVVRKKPVLDGAPLLSDKDVDRLISFSHAVHVAMEVRRYQQNIVVFLRMHRAVEGGVSVLATKQFDLLIRCMAPLHSLTYATPSLVALAARKIYPHRIRIVNPQKERSMQWGSDLEAVTAYLKDVTPASIVEDVLEMVETPL